MFSKDAFRPKLTFTELSTWSCQRDCTASYVVAQDLPVTSRDWIGLYKVSPHLLSEQERPVVDVMHVNKLQLGCTETARPKNEGPNRTKMQDQQ